jgi:sulfur transfer complex TusBCD TusB component (DsrH family)
MPLDGEDTIFLMSDGVSSFALSPDGDKIEECFLVPINNFLLNEKTKAKALKALTSTLSNKKAASLNSDDKTLLWAKL